MTVYLKKENLELAKGERVMHEYDKEIVRVSIFKVILRPNNSLVSMYDNSLKYLFIFFAMDHYYVFCFSMLNNIIIKMKVCLVRNYT